MFIKEELSKIDFQIKCLENKKNVIIQQFINDRNKKDQETIITHYDTLMSLNRQKRPNVFNKIITCFPISTHVCCGFGGSIGKIYLKDLLELWSSGYMYNGHPITNITTTNSGYRSISFIENGKIRTITNKDCELDVRPYQKILSKVLTKDKIPSERYSETSINDMFTKVR